MLPLKKEEKPFCKQIFFHNAKENLVMIMTKDIANFDIIVITQAVEALQIVCVTKDAKDRRKLLQSYIMDQIMTTILSWRASRRT